MPRRRPEENSEPCCSPCPIESGQWREAVPAFLHSELQHRWCFLVPWGQHPLSAKSSVTFPPASPFLRALHPIFHPAWAQTTLGMHRNHPKPPGTELGKQKDRWNHVCPDAGKPTRSSFGSSFRESKSRSGNIGSNPAVGLQERNLKKAAGS